MITFIITISAIFYILFGVAIRTMLEKIDHPTKVIPILIFIWPLVLLIIAVYTKFLDNN